MGNNSKPNNNGVQSNNELSQIVTVMGVDLESATLVQENFEDDVRPDNKKKSIDVYQISDPYEFLNVLKETWNTIPEDERWKVESPQTPKAMEDWIADHPNAKMYVTPNGTTVAVNGEDIISVASPQGVGEGITAVQWAISQGGRKLDSYESNYGFYRKLGFKVNSYTPFKEGVNEFWVKERDNPEDIIFMTYEGKEARGAYNMGRKQYDELLQRYVKPNVEVGYDTAGSDEWEDTGYYKAQVARDGYIEENRPELEKKWNTR